ncbi:MAG: TraB/GumN family protein [Gammaproteobacteria bacterium]
MKNLKFQAFELIHKIHHGKSIFHSLKFIYITILILSLQSNAYAGNENSLLWRIDKAGVDSSYILATMHSEDPRVLTLPDNYNDIFVKAKSFTAEIDLSINNNSALAKIMILPGNKNLKKIIGDELFKKSVIMLKDFGIPENVVIKLKPWAVLMTLSYPKPKTGLFLDKVLFDKAIKLNKKTYGLETAEEQIAIFDKISYLHQTILLRDSMKQYPHFSEQLEHLKKLYLKGDLDGLQRYNEEIMLKGNYRVASKFMVQLIDQRNIKMVNRMQPRLLEGGAFIGVGALHLPGEVGILQLLREQNYQLTPVQ